MSERVIVHHETGIVEAGTIVSKPTHVAPGETVKVLIRFDDGTFLSVPEFRCVVTK